MAAQALAAGSLLCSIDVTVGNGLPALDEHLGLHQRAGRPASCLVFVDSVPSLSMVLNKHSKTKHGAKTKHVLTCTCFGKLVGLIAGLVAWLLKREKDKMRAELLAGRSSGKLLLQTLPEKKTPPDVLLNELSRKAAEDAQVNLSALS